MKNFKSMITPYILKESQDRMTQLDVFSELMSQRIIYFGEEVNSSTCNTAISQLLYMYSQDRTRPIHMYLNTPGGSVYSGLALYDTMKLVSKTLPLYTYVCGLAASMGSILLSAGTRGCRLALPHSRILIHQPLSGTGEGSTQASDIEILAKETNTLKEELTKILSDASGKKYEDVVKDCDRDHWIKAEDALPGKYGRYGLIDGIIEEL
jgi:ATP-dependent Clp protease protease subunit